MAISSENTPAPGPSSIMPMTFLLQQPIDAENSTTTHTPFNSPYPQNESHQHGCMEVVFSQMEYLPWDNPDNIISAGTQSGFFCAKNNVLAFLFLIGGPGNVINMAVFRKQGLRERVNACLFALALADGLTLTTAIIYNGEQLILQFTTQQRTGPVKAFLMNHYLLGVQNGFGYVSSILSAIIALERCHCVLQPLSYQKAMRTRTMAAIIVTIYILMVGLNFLVMGSRARPGCIFDPETGVTKEKLFLGEFYKAHKQVLQFIRSGIFGIALPVAVIVLVMVSTIVTSVKLNHIVKWRSTVTMSLSNKEVGLTKMLIASSILFILCSVPIACARNASFVFPEMDVGGRNENLFLAVIQINHMFIYINSSFNIFVYYAMGARYRESFWALFGRKTLMKGKITNNDIMESGSRGEKKTSQRTTGEKANMCQLQH